MATVLPLLPTLSIIMPVLDEEKQIGETLTGLAPLRARGSEVIVVDGGSRDSTVEIARPRADCLVIAPRGRAGQMNAGAVLARGEVLLFLHADAELPADADRLVLGGLSGAARCWGRFDVRIAGPNFLLAIVATLMNWRSRLTSIATGDQAIFVNRDIFFEVGGFPDIALMEDVVLSKRLKRISRPICLRARVTTSGRSWQRHGVLRSILLMWWLRLAFLFGADPASLARQYGYDPREP